MALPGLAPPDDGAHPADGLSDDVDDDVDDIGASSDTRGLEKARDSGRALDKNAEPSTLEITFKFKLIDISVEVNLN